LNKPLSVHDEAFGLEYAWDMDVEDEWATFLEEHPQAFDSLDILDDLATALIQHPQFGAHWLDRTLLAPILKRAHNIIISSLESQSDAKLIWGFTQNRPVLRNLARLAMLYSRVDEEIETERLMQWLLDLNPEDNHGFRRYLMNCLLRKGENEKALALSDQYPNDDQIETRFGRVLALYRLGQTQDAKHALCEALDCLPKGLRQITHERVKKPKIDPIGVEYGGDDQAWLYREEMRDVWKSTPGVITWMKKTAKHCRQEPRH
jgi:tetratricopeptide (TPR) repeat protein